MAKNAVHKLVDAQAMPINIARQFGAATRPVVLPARR
jgi:hypothetical protein